MENAVEALKMVFAVMMFVAALSLSVSSLSKANRAVTSIISLNDRETEYNYVEPTGNTRIVGVETVVPTMYKAYKENFEIYFYDQDGETPLIIYYATDNKNNRKKDEFGNEIGINCIDGSEVFANAQEAVKHLNQILEGNPSKVDEKYKNQLNTIDYPSGLYNYLSGKKFTEQLGEYYQNDSENTPEVNKTKKRVITYTLIP